jgi:hypothetical protein
MIDYCKQIGLRWRTEKELISGKGEKMLINKDIPQVFFCYMDLNNGFV